MALPNAFRDALKQFSSFALAEVKRSLESGAKPSIGTHEIAVLVGPRTWDKKDIQVIRWSDLLYPCEGELKASVLYGECVRQMVAIPTIAQHLDQTVSFASWGTKYETKYILFSFIGKLLELNGTPEFSEIMFSSAYDELEAFFVRDHMEWEVWATLEHCLCPDGPISLGNGLRIKPMPTELLETVFPMGSVGGYQLDDIMFWESVLHLELVLSKTIGTIVKTSELPADAGAKIVEDALTSLRLSKPQRVWTSVLVARPKRWIPLDTHPHYYNSEPHPRPSTSEYQVTLSDGPSLSGLINTVHSLDVKRFPALALALRRFNMSYDRPLPEDRLIDQMISSEALYLADMNDDDRGEKQFRLALRASYFLEVGAQRKNVYRDMKCAYNLRSDIVHGGTVSPPKVDGVQISIGEFANKTEEYLRRTLIKFLDLSQQPGALPKLVKWDDLLFPNSHASS
jgi:hypothetical protein